MKNEAEDGSDRQIQERVFEELKWDPRVEETDVGVEVDKGVVTLTGTVDSELKKHAAEQAVLRVKGLGALANNVQIQPFHGGLSGDAEVADRVASALESRAFIPAGVIAEVANRRVTLKGEVEWEYQRALAESTAREVKGVLAVVNELTLSQPAVSAEEIHNSIEQAFTRHAQIDARSIDIAVDGSTLTLTGFVSSSIEKREAEHEAWLARGVTDVVNLITVRP